jgi:hypothetical protein
MNIMYHAGTTSQEVTYTMPDHWAVKDLGNPIHAYVWDDNGYGEIDYLTELVDITHKITVNDGVIYVEDVVICNDILITIHLDYLEKGEDGFYWEDAPEDDDDVQDYKDRPYVFAASVDEWDSETTLTSQIKGKLPKDPAVWGTVLDATLEDTPVAGITLSLYNQKGRCVKSFTTDEYGFYLFDNLKPETYVLEIEIPLDVLLEGLEETDLVLRITMEVKLSKGDYIQVSIFIDGESTTIEGPPGLDPSMSVVDSSGSSGSSSHPKDNSRPFDGPTVGDSGYIAEPLVSNFNLGIPILVAWFASVLSLAYTFDMRKRKKQARLDLEASIWNNSLEWLYEEDLTK